MRRHSITDHHRVEGGSAIVARQCYTSIRLPQLDLFRYNIANLIIYTGQQQQANHGVEYASQITSKSCHNV